MTDTNSPQSPSKDQPMDDANSNTQQTPFSNLPILPPSHSTTASPLNSPIHSPSGRKILVAHSPRSRSPKKIPTGESEDPAQDIVDWCNDIPADPTTSTSGNPSRPVLPLRRSSPVRPVFILTPSRPPTPNVFDTMTGSTRPIITDFTNGALRNAPVLQPNHNFSTGTGGHAENPFAPGTVLDPALGGIAPGTAGVLSDRQHREMAEEGRRRHEEAVKKQREYDLGNYEDD